MKLLILLFLHPLAYADDVWVGGFKTVGGGGGGGTNPNPLAAQFIPSLSYSGPSWFCGADQSTKIFQTGGNCGEYWSLTASTPSAVRNEWSGGQLCVMNAPSQLQNVSLEFSNLTNAQTGNVISSNTEASSLTPSYYQGNLVVMVETYTFISTPTVFGSTNPAYFQQYNVEIPDILIYTVDPYWHQKTNRKTITIQQGQNQCWWYDVFAGTGMPSGYYSGTAVLSTGATPSTVNPIATMVVAFELADATMSATATYPSFTTFGYGDLCTQSYGSNSTCNRLYAASTCGDTDTCARIVSRDGAAMALDHRWSAGYDVGGWTNATMEATFSELYSGNVSTRGFANPLLPGAHLTSVQVNGIGATSGADATTWNNDFTNNGYNTKSGMPFDYACDEPGSFTGCFNSCNATSPPIPCLVTTAYNTALTAGATGYISIMMPLINNWGGTRVNTVNWVNTASGGTRTAGGYSDCVSGAGTSGNGPCIGTFNGGNAVGTGDLHFGSPNPHIDGTAMANLHTWIGVAASSFTAQLNSTFTQCFTGTCGNAAGTDSTWGTKGMQYDGNGDETWVGAGTPSQIGVSTSVFLPTIRLKESRNGEQFAEYKTILNNSGQVNTWWTQLYTFYQDEQNVNENPYKTTLAYTGTYTKARQNLVCAIHQLKWGGGATCGW